MTLKLDRIQKTPTLYRTHEDGPLLNRMVHEYNAVNGLYDVCVDETLGVWFRTNCRPTPTPNKYHIALMQHFKIEIPEGVGV